MNGDRIFHQKLGNGNAVDGNELTIQFD